ncbi:hypothetical protein AMK26_10350 [Streptomyces sp. CB03234]|uniref:hypothetical protein n=1 Tax=Streptomyces sp. (strain CB03234) TaxID=1703937 RepID=UPI00093CF257|nr:hypothetical protein [Streptomyces sp. CB03234]OKK06417.1 hypothetical protein AMK26_10350 [Streptomyces sp. CB03234]
MAKFVLLDCRLFAVGADLSGASNKIELAAEHEEKEATNYRSGGWKEVRGGLGSAEISGEGQWNAGDPSLVDDASFAQLGGLGPWTVCPQDSTVGALAYLTRAMRADYKLGEAVGEIAPWTGTAKSSWPLARGQIAHPPGLARAASGSGTALNLGAVSSGQRLYAALHVLSVAGTTPSLTARIESDADASFASPTTVATFTAATAAGGEILRTDGTAITDTHYRVAWTITGTNPSFMFAVSLGIR